MEGGEQNGETASGFGMAGMAVSYTHLPAYAGIVCDQHSAAHQHFIYSHFTKGDQMDAVAFGLELIGIFLEFCVKIEINLQIIFFQDVCKPPGI